MKKKVIPPTSGASPISGSKMTLIIPLSWKIQDSFYKISKHIGCCWWWWCKEYWKMSCLLKVLWHQLWLAPSQQRQCPHRRHNCKVRSAGKNDWHSPQQAFVQRHKNTFHTIQTALKWKMCQTNLIFKSRTTSLWSTSCVYAFIPVILRGWKWEKHFKRNL